jgi:hypothetical protein
MKDSVTFKIVDASMSVETKMLKDKQLLFTRAMVVIIRDGKSSMLIKQHQLKIRDLMKNSDSTAQDHSTLSQDSLWEELLSAMVPTTSGLEDGERILLLNNSSLTALPRPSDPNNGKITPWKSNPMEDQATSE